MFDLDGTLAEYTSWKGEAHIGPPIPTMIQRLLKYLAEGYEVRIFTARAINPSAVPHIERWCEENIGCILPVTNQKDYDMIRLYDDRAVSVEHNTGKCFSFDTYPHTT